MNNIFYVSSVGIVWNHDYRSIDGLVLLVYLSWKHAMESNITWKGYFHILGVIFGAGNNYEHKWIEWCRACCKSSVWYTLRDGHDNIFVVVEGQGEILPNVTILRDVGGDLPKIYQQMKISIYSTLAIFYKSRIICFHAILFVS